MKPLDNSIMAMADEMSAWRRDLHRHPELAYQETRTAAFVAETLRGFGLDAVETGIGGTGVVGVLHGATGPGGEARTILLRADMDALPIEEATGAAYASARPGKMHACGHDGHTTMLLGAARRLAETRDFDGSVVFVFQPAEEGGAGAKAMLDDGLLERFPARAVFGMHNMPGLPVGRFAFRPGPTMALSDEFTITITGVGAHAAMPHLGRDPILAGAALVQALQSIIARRVDPVDPAVLSITEFHGGAAKNVMPETATLGGTIRAFSTATHQFIRAEVARQCAALGEAFGVAIAFGPSLTPYPPVINDPDMTAFAGDVLAELVGEAALVRDPPLIMGGEDFAFLAEARPGAFVFIGNGDSAALHHPAYDFNDAAAPLGVAYWVRLAQAALPRA
ncbi:MAG: amidohydrolase [Alphaproteobacteria bacterium]|nr:amidohydrolase [Alphaproteobacteria bacterium]